MTTQNPPTHPPLRQRFWDFFGSMRLAIGLLSVLAIASAIGTLVKQNQPMIAYVNQFGAFWAQWFERLGLYDVYNQLWFLAILFFLLASTSVCLIRNTPKMLRDMRDFKNHTRTNSLRHLLEHDEWGSQASLADLTQHAADVLHEQGYQTRAKKSKAGTYISAKSGRFNRIGYVFTHLAIVVICLGGLIDSELSIRAQVALFGKVPQTYSNTPGNVPKNGVLSSGTLSYRGEKRLVEGETIGHAELTYDQDHYLLQELPFNITLNRFAIDFYSTGMPKRFASDVTVTDKATKETFTQIIEVNHPLRYKGVAVYQASFDDGGSAFDLDVFPLNGTVAQAEKTQATMYQPKTLSYGGKNYSLEWREFKTMDVKPFGDDANKNLNDAVQKALQTTGREKVFKNMGPVINFVLRDEQGQDVEFSNYMSPLTIDNFPVLVSGVRTDRNLDFVYSFIPADGEQSPRDFMRLRAALANSKMREQAVAQYMRGQTNLANFPAGAVQKSAQKTIDLFAQGGNALSDVLARAPEDQKKVIVEFTLSQLQATMWQLLQLARAAEGLPALESTEHNATFMQISIKRLSEAADYPAPFYVQLAGFKQVQASVLQMTRSPGQFWVYLGSLMLVLGTLAMMFIQERRVWLHILPTPDGHRLICAMHSSRRTLAYQGAWARLRNRLFDLTADKSSNNFPDNLSDKSSAP
jgi:cytochrome c biogenesis protein